MNPAAEPAVSAIEVEPFVQQSAREAWDAFKADPLLYIAASLVVSVIAFVSIGIVAGPLIVGLIELVQRRRRGQPASVSDVFDGLSSFAPAFFAFVLVAIGALIGFGLLVVPGLFVMVVTVFVFHEIAYRRAHAADALRASFQIARHHVLHVLILLVGLAALNALGGAVMIALVLTVPFAVVWTTVAYEILTGQTPDRAPLAVTPPPPA